MNKVYCPHAHTTAGDLFHMPAIDEGNVPTVLVFCEDCGNDLSDKMLAAQRADAEHEGIGVAVADVKFDPERVRRRR